jgi:integrase
MIAQPLQTDLPQKIADNEDHGYFDILQKNEPGLRWLDFAAKLYRRSHSVNTITSYCKGICAFREMIVQDNKTLTQTIEEIKAQTNGLAYKLLDSFATWCDASGRFAPRTIRNNFLAVVKLFEYLEIDLDERKIKNIKVSLPQPRAIKDEIPTNEDLRKIENSASPAIRGFIQIMRDTGFEPIDVCELRVKDIEFDETPSKIAKDREKTGEPLEGFLSQGTVDTLKLIILEKAKQSDDYLFSENMKGYTLKNIRDRYNLAVARAGFGTVRRQKGGRRYLAIVDKIDGHKFGKFHLKVFKKRWFTLVVSSGIPEYVAQGMLGRKQYLDEYMRLSLEQKRTFATKILKVVSLYNEKPNSDEVRKQAANVMGLDDLTPEQAEKIKSIFASMLAAPEDKLTRLFKAVNSNE